MFRASCVAILLITSACNHDPVCVDAVPAAAPQVTNHGPVEHSIIVPSTIDLEVAGSPEAELEAIEVEIWQGSSRAWAARSLDPSMRRFRLTDGTFEGAALTLGDLEPWKEHTIRARFVTRADGCSTPGEWSAGPAFRTDDGSAALFDPAVVRDYRIELPAASIAGINAQAFPPGCVPYNRDYFEGTLTTEGQTFAGVGVKTKGGCGSSRDLNGKASFKVNLSWEAPSVSGCPDERRLGGLSTLTFNNMVQDPSMSHERLAYALYRHMGVPVPRVALARVFVNDDYYGVYLNIESIDRRFLARNFGDNDGMLYEGTYFCDVVASNVRDDDTGCITREFSPNACSTPDPGADPLDYTPMHQLIARLDAVPPQGFYPELTDLIDMDALLGLWATEAVLAHWDGFIFDIRNNYRLYHNPSTGLWTVIPTGVDQTFQIPNFDPWAVSSRVAQACLAEPDCEAAFAAKLRQAVDAMTVLDLTGMRASMRAQTDMLLSPDPGREFSRNDYNNVHADTQRFLDGRAATVLAQLASHGY